MYPVVVTGPKIEHCRGILSGKMPAVQLEKKFLAKILHSLKTSMPQKYKNLRDNILCKEYIVLFIFIYIPW